MSCKLLLAICALVCLSVTIEAASLRIPANSVRTKLDYEGVQANVRGSRQAYEDDASGEDSDEDDEEEDAEKLQQNIIQQQQAQEQALNESQESSDEDDEEGDDNEDDDDEEESSFLRRRRRDVTAENEITNEIVESAKPSEEDNKTPQEQVPAEAAVDSESVTAAVTPAPSSPNTNVLILIRDAIKKVTTELPNSQQVATSAQQYFQLFEHFLQQTIEQVIGDDDDEDDAETVNAAPESETSAAAAAAAPTEGDKESTASDKEPAVAADKEKEPMESKPEAEVPVSEKQPETQEAKA